MVNLSDIANFFRKRSIWIVAYCTGCCAVELPPSVMAMYDMERFGVMPNPAVRQADILMVGGYTNVKTLSRIIITYELMLDPKYVMALGSCPQHGGIYWDSYSIVNKLDLYIPVDVWVPGCMPRPENIYDGLVRLMNKIQRGEANGWKKYKENYEYYKKNQEKVLGKNWRERYLKRWLEWKQEPELNI